VAYRLLPPGDAAAAASSAGVSRRGALLVQLPGSGLLAWLAATAVLQQPLPAAAAAEPRQLEPAERAAVDKALSRVVTQPKVKIEPVDSACLHTSLCASVNAASQAVQDAVVCLAATCSSRRACGHASDGGASATLQPCCWMRRCCPAAAGPGDSEARISRRWHL
jgi:hypothetical protein